MAWLALFVSWTIGVVVYVLTGSAAAALFAVALPLAGYWLYRTERKEGRDA